MSVLSVVFHTVVFFSPAGSCRSRRKTGIRPDAYLCLRFVSVSLALIISKRSRERNQNIGVLCTIIWVSNCRILCRRHSAAAVFDSPVQTEGPLRSFLHTRTPSSVFPLGALPGRITAKAPPDGSAFGRCSGLLRPQCPGGRRPHRWPRPESGPRRRPRAGTSRGSGPPRPRPEGCTPHRADTCSAPT